ncbi:MAG: HAD-IA family hydrolase [Gammaproteobacteria bacterium]|nr:HAD-IA family hydrolase [Gammaproteobacteria bacterium]
MSVAKSYRLIVFDWDGTLADSTARIVESLRFSLEAVGVEAPHDEKLKDVIGLGLMEGAEVLMPGAGERQHSRFIETYRGYYLSAQHGPTQLFPGTLEILNTLDGMGYWLAVATGKGRRGLDRSLAETGCGHLFSLTRCVDECPSKPHPQMLIDIMDGLAIAPEETLMVGDSEFDMLMARNAGADALAVSYGAHDRERLLSCGPVACIESLPELLIHLGAAAGEKYDR